MVLIRCRIWKSQAMKTQNKKTIEKEKREQHKLKLAEDKRRRKNGTSLERAIPYRSEKPTFLIVCEGENTEPSYFSQFRLSSATIKGEGKNTITLVEKTIMLKNENDYDQVWCVFDRDPGSFSANNFNRAIEIARNNSIGIAYSNQAFEYWIILHFEDHQGGGIDRNDYNDIINSYVTPLGAYYDGNGRKIIDEKLFDLLNGIDTITNKPRRELAIKRAKRNYDKFDHISPATEESSTTVYLLVEEIIKAS